jgi:rhodanese-related sulfurtransferase
MPTSTVRGLGLLAALLLPSLCSWSGTFALSQAPVADDPSLTQRDSAKLWPHVNLQEARRLQATEGVVFVDGRSHHEWELARIPGAVSLTGAEFDNRYPTVRTRLIHAKAVVIYCHGFSCGEADFIARLLAAKGLRNMAVFSGGFPQWQSAGLPLEGREAEKKRAR